MTNPDGVIRETSQGELMLRVHEVLHLKEPAEEGLEPLQPRPAKNEKRKKKREKEKEKLVFLH